MTVPNEDILDEGAEERHLACVGYRFVPAAPRESDAPPPRSLRETAERIKHCLLRSTLAPFELVALALELPCNIIRGLSVRRLPEAPRDAVRFACELADVREGRKQEQGLRGGTRGLEGTPALARLEAIQAELRERRGIEVRVLWHPDGRPIIVAVPAEKEDAATAIARMLLDEQAVEAEEADREFVD